MSAAQGTRHVGRAIIESLEAHGVERVFEVPGESFLPLLDGLHDSSIQTVVCRQEGGASYMADATGRMTGRPGVVMVTRGPGAANAMGGIHVAWQDAVPLVMFVGLIPTSDRDRESFQEFDPAAWFGSQAKKVFVIDDPASASRVVARAFHVASTGRPGPVVVGVPEDVAHHRFDGPLTPPLPLPTTAVDAEALDAIRQALAEAERPLLFVGGPGWDAATAGALASFAERNHLPVLHDWHASDRIPTSSPANAGSLGYGRSEAAARLFDEADVVLSIGTTPRDVSSDGYTLRPSGTHWVVSTDPELVGVAGEVTGHVLASPSALVRLLDGLELPTREDWAERLRRAHAEMLAFQTPGTGPGEGDITVEEVFAALDPLLPEDVISCVGAGDHALAPTRYVPVHHFPAQLASGTGTMGYSVPSAVAAGLEQPGRFVLCVTGDGDFLMNGQELATAAQYGVPMLVVVSDNSEFATIRGHQVRHFPHRVSGTQLGNPDFAAFGEMVGGRGWRVTERSQLAPALAEAVESVLAGGIAVVQVRTAHLDEGPTPTPDTSRPDQNEESR